MTDDHQTPDAPPLDDDAVRTIIGRLARPHRSGGRVVERASLLAAGTDFDTLMAWIEAHGGEPEALAPPSVARGLHSARPAARSTTPLRFVLPPDVLR